MTEAEKFFNFGLQYYNGDGELFSMTKVSIQMVGDI